MRHEESGGIRRRGDLGRRRPRRAADGDAITDIRLDDGAIDLNT
jgi:hypothetical protein